MPSRRASEDLTWSLWSFSSSISLERTTYSVSVASWASRRRSKPRSCILPSRRPCSRETCPSRAARRPLSQVRSGQFSCFHMYIYSPHTMRRLWPLFSAPAELSPHFVRRLGGLFPAQSRITQLIHYLGASRLAFRRSPFISPGRMFSPTLIVQEAGGTFSASTCPVPTAGLCTTIRALHHDYWRKVREGENANEGKPTTEFCRWSRACLAPRGEGCAEDCAHVWHAALRVGKRQ